MANRATSVTRLPETSELVAGHYQEGARLASHKKIECKQAFPTLACFKPLNLRIT